MARGDITAGEVFEDREMLDRLGYGIFDLAWGKSGVGFENVRDFSYVVAEDKDPKIYRRKVFEMLGRYYNNDLAKAMWNKFIDHKWVLSERAGHEVDLRTAALDWFNNYGHAFLKEWTFRRQVVPERIRNQREPSKGWAGLVMSRVLPDLKELLDAGFTVTDIIKAAALVHPLKSKKTGERWRARALPLTPSFPLRRPNGTHAKQDRGRPDDEDWKDDSPYFLIKRVNPEERGHYYMLLVARLTGHEIRTPEEAEKRWREILEHKWYMSEREGFDVGIKAAALDYYRRLNLLQEAEQGQEG